MNLTRRGFLTGIAGVALLKMSPRRSIAFEAISGAQLPHRLLIPVLTDDFSGYFERREYRAPTPAHLDLLHRALVQHGIRPLVWQHREPSIYLFPFDSLAARAQTWTNFASDPAWIELRDSVQVTGVSIYVRNSAIRGNG